VEVVRRGLMGMEPERREPTAEHTRRNRLRKLLLTRENVYALLLCLLVLALIVVTTDAAPTWIYQGF